MRVPTIDRTSACNLHSRVAIGLRKMMSNVQRVSQVQEIKIGVPYKRKSKENRDNSVFETRSMYKMILDKLIIFHDAVDWQNYKRFHFNFEYFIYLKIN